MATCVAATYRLRSQMCTVTQGGNLPDHARIYTDTPEKNRLIEIKKSKEMKKQEQERKAKAKKMKRALNLLLDNKETKPKKYKKTIENDSEDQTDISLREC